MSVYWWLADASESASDIWLLYLWSLRCACMDRKENLQSQTGLSGIFSEIALNDKRRWILGTKESNLNSQRTMPPGTKRFCFIDYLLLKMYWEPGVTLLTIMRAGARFTVSPFKWSGRFGSVVWCWGGFCCVCFVVLCHPTGPVFRHLLDLSQISSIGCKDCHYRDDARSNGPKKIDSLDREG